MQFNAVTVEPVAEEPPTQDNKRKKGQEQQAGVDDSCMPNITGECRWDPSNGMNQWWVDAFSVDPSAMVEGLTGLWCRGTPQPIRNTKLENASVGTLPLILVYIAVHQQYGTYAWYPYHGARHGAVDEEGEKKMFQGFKYWFDDISEADKEDIVRNRYCNQPSAIEAYHNKSSKEEWEAFTTGKFNPRWFMVCCCIA